MVKYCEDCKKYEKQLALYKNELESYLPYGMCKLFLRLIFLPKQTIKFFKNLCAYSKILFHDEEWSDSYLLNIIEFKLERYYKALLNDGYGLHDPLRAKEIRVALNHLYRYRDIEKYIEDTKYNIWTEPVERNGETYYHMCDDATKYQKIKFSQKMDLEQQHLMEFWEHLKKSQRWGI